jgi:ribosomal protein L18E
MIRALECLVELYTKTNRSADLAQWKQARDELKRSADQMAAVRQVLAFSFGWPIGR